MALQCKRCGSGMPDNANRCGVCNAPVSEDVAAAPAVGSGGIVAGIPGLPTASAPQPSGGYMGQSPAAGGGEVRVSLTGEVYEVPPPTPRATGPGGYPASGGKPGAPPLPVRGPQGGARPRYGIPAPEEAPAKGVPVAALVLVLLVLAGAGFGAFWWFQKQQAPKMAAQKVGDLIVAEKWGELYDMIEFSPEVKNQLASRGGDPKQMMVAGLTMVGAMASFKDPKLGEVTVNGDTATAKMTMTMEMNGQTTTNTEDLRLRLVNGAWKLDGSVSQGFGFGAGGQRGMQGGPPPGMGGAR